jgi:hypothetical protein
VHGDDLAGGNTALTRRVAIVALAALGPSLSRARASAAL